MINSATLTGKCLSHNEFPGGMQTRLSNKMKIALSPSSRELVKKQELVRSYMGITDPVPKVHAKTRLNSRCWFLLLRNGIVPLTVLLATMDCHPLTQSSFLVQGLHLFSISYSMAYLRIQFLKLLSRWPNKQVWGGNTTALKYLTVAEMEHRGSTASFISVELLARTSWDHVPTRCASNHPFEGISKIFRHYYWCLLRRRRSDAGIASG